jgi:hypothetical protein
MKSLKRKSKLVIPLILIGTLFLVASTISEISLAFRPTGALPEDEENSNNEIMYRPTGAIPEKINERLELTRNFLEVN